MPIYFYLRFLLGQLYRILINLLLETQATETKVAVYFHTRFHSLHIIII